MFLFWLYASVPHAIGVKELFFVEEFCKTYVFFDLRFKMKWKNCIKFVRGK